MDKLVQHAHCEICGKVINVGDRVCGSACQEKLDEATKMKKRSMFYFVLIIIAAVLLTKIPWQFGG